MPEPIHDIATVVYCAECLREITTDYTMLYGKAYHKSCWQRSVDTDRYEAATDADYDALYEPETGGES